MTDPKEIKSTGDFTKGADAEPALFTPSLLASGNLARYATLPEGDEDQRQYKAWRLGQVRSDLTKAIKALNPKAPA